MPELPIVEHAGFVFIELLELLAKLFDFVLVGHFDEHVHGCAFELAGPFEAFQSIDHVMVNLELLRVTHFLYISEPLMLECLVGCYALSGVNNEKLFD